MESVYISDISGLAYMSLGLLLGAILKGATGAGLPIIAIPVIAAIYDIRVAVVLLVIPNFLTNIWQIAKFKQHDLNNNLARNFAIAGFFGAGLGTVLLAYLPITLLNLLVSVVVFLYIALRLVRPQFKLSQKRMLQSVFAAGSCAGMLQGAIGLSSPITITFLHAGHLPRLTFVYTASLFFATMSIMQLPLQLALGLMTKELMVLSLLAMIPITIGLPIGERIGRKISSVFFDRIILSLLALVAIKMLLDSGVFTSV